RHAKRRLTSPIFLEKYDHIFKDKKEIFLKTDNANLFDYSKETLTEHGYKLSDITYDLHKEKEDIITTEYEDKFRKENIPIAFLKATKED
ncbi:MAG: tRNA (guanosine(46)-N7)-methyltransferase TrmB, partial [Romboutsia sp.]|nr:tRNA (guanosine(46)-N7)-methyltransferase TrmB [Romboutsia sp.]